MPRRRITTEHDEQVAVVQWARLQEGAYPELRLLFAVPNGASLSGGARSWKRLEAEGARPGVPDLVLPVPRNGYAGAFIEMKRGRNKPSDLQAEWLDALTEQGYYATACWGAEEAIKEIQAYLGIEEQP